MLTEGRAHDGRGHTCTQSLPPKRLHHDSLHEVLPTSRPRSISHVQPNLQDWDWSPNAPDATFAAYQAEQGNLPARVVITKLPSREELRQKNLFSVAGAPKRPHCACACVACLPWCARRTCSRWQVRSMFLCL